MLLGICLDVDNISPHIVHPKAYASDKEALIGNGVFKEASA